MSHWPVSYTHLDVYKRQTLLIAFAPANGVTQFLLNMLYYYVVVNISLAVFNLIPLPPLDGSRIVGADVYKRQRQSSPHPGPAPQTPW